MISGYFLRDTFRKDRNARWSTGIICHQLLWHPGNVLFSFHQPEMLLSCLGKSCSSHFGTQFYHKNPSRIREERWIMCTFSMENMEYLDIEIGRYQIFNVTAPPPPIPKKSAAKNVDDMFSFHDFCDFLVAQKKASGVSCKFCCHPSYHFAHIH